MGPSGLPEQRKRCALLAASACGLACSRMMLAPWAAASRTSFSAVACRRKRGPRLAASSATGTPCVSQGSPITASPGWLPGPSCKQTAWPPPRLSCQPWRSAGGRSRLRVRYQLILGYPGCAEVHIIIRLWVWRSWSLVVKRASRQPTWRSLHASPRGGITFCGHEALRRLFEGNATA